MSGHLRIMLALQAYIIFNLNVIESTLLFTPIEEVVFLLSKVTSNTRKYKAASYRLIEANTSKLIKDHRTYITFDPELKASVMYMWTRLEIKAFWVSKNPKIYLEKIPIP